MAPIVLGIVTFFFTFLFLGVVVEFALIFTAALGLVLLSVGVRPLLVGRVVGTLHRSMVGAASLGVATNIGVLTSYVRLVDCSLLLFFGRRNGFDGRSTMSVHRSRRLSLSGTKAVIRPLVSTLLLLELLVLIIQGVVLSLSGIEPSAPSAEFRNLSLLQRGSS